MEDVNASGVSSLSTSSDEQETSKKKMTIKSLKTWNERKKSLLTDLLEKGPSLWDMFPTPFSLREMQAKDNPCVSFPCIESLYLFVFSNLKSSTKLL